MAFSTSAVDDILKDDYQGPVREQLNSSTVLLKQLQRRTKDFHGRKAYIPLRKGRNVGVGSSTEGGALPASGNQQYDHAEFTVKLNYGTIELTGPAIEAASSNVGAFVRGLQSEMEGLMRDIKVMMNRQFWHDGSSNLTNCGTTTASLTVVVDSTKFLQVGMPIDIRNRTTGAAITDGTARSVATIASGTTFTMTGNVVTTSSSHAIFRVGTRDSAAWGTHQDCWGLQALVSDLDPEAFASPHDNGLTDDVGTIDRNTDSFWKANLVGNSGTLRALTLDLMQQAYDQSDIEGDTVPGLILTNHALKRRYGGLLVADKRYPAGGEITLDGGYKALEFNGTPLVADKDASLTATPSVLRRMYFLSMSSLELQVLKDWGWLQRDGSVLKMKPSTTTYSDSWQAFLGAYMELAVSRPNANTLLDDIDENP